mmetsp:Transcript_34572/g.101589  ORF Transcript_34572/g.101589 Transcript_34572/m.101589 type:complete len:300 (-) Transcript_34572:421-1320(-)
MRAPTTSRSARMDRSSTEILTSTASSSPVPKFFPPPATWTSRSARMDRSSTEIPTSVVSSPPVPRRSPVPPMCASAMTGATFLAIPPTAVPSVPARRNPRPVPWTCSSAMTESSSTGIPRRTVRSRPAPRCARERMARPTWPPAKELTACSASGNRILPWTVATPARVAIWTASRNAPQCFALLFLRKLRKMRLPKPALSMALISWPAKLLPPPMVAIPAHALILEVPPVPRWHVSHAAPVTATMVTHTAPESRSSLETDAIHADAVILELPLVPRWPAPLKTRPLLWTWRRLPVSSMD